MDSFPLFVPAARPRTTPIRLGTAALLLAGLVPAQTWLQLQPSVRPAGRSDQNMVFDAARNVTLMFGGFCDFTPQNLGILNDTWSWNGTDWTPLPSSVAPPARSTAGMSYDAARQRVVLFGGTGGNLLADTWEWDGATWAQRTPLQVPAARSGCAMTFDPVHALTVLFGGNPGLDDTWTWDGTDWAQLTPAHRPAARGNVSMVYDRARSRGVLFGGMSSASLPLDDTWEWDGIDWSPQPTAHAPSPRHSAALAYDTANHRVVLFGGNLGGPPWLNPNDTWEYDGTDWTLQPTSVAPSPERPVMAYDEARAQVVMFGGHPFGPTFYDETWRYTHANTNPAAAFTAFGQGCPGSFGTPQLALAGGLPIVGTTFRIACTNLQLDHVTTLWLGFSKTTWVLGSLPYDLGPLGMPGCTLFVSGDVPLFLLNWNGTAVWETTIPNNPQFVGLPFFLQAGVIDRINALGMIVTNAGEVLVGDH